MFATKINAFFVYASVIMLSLCLILNIYTYYSLKHPEFKTQQSERVLGVGDQDVYLEMVWSFENPSKLPYRISKSELYFYENEDPVARIYFSRNQLIKAFTKSNLNVNLTINKDFFEMLMQNNIDTYSFNMQGYAQARVLFFPKKVEINQYIPINISNLLSDFLDESFRNAVIFEGLTISRSYIESEVIIINRTGFDLFIDDFEGHLEINNNISGSTDVFTPISFTSDEKSKTTYIRFISEEPIVDIPTAYSYLITGYLSVQLWELEYVFPIIIMGEEAN
jgi:hypothetical protein